MFAAGGQLLEMALYQGWLQNQATNIPGTGGTGSISSCTSNQIK